jgi:hypothetical protein
MRSCTDHAIYRTYLIDEPDLFPIETLHHKFVYFPWYSHEYNWARFFRSTLKDILIAIEYHLNPVCLYGQMVQVLARAGPFFCLITKEKIKTHVLSNVIAISNV